MHFLNDLPTGISDEVYNDITCLHILALSYYRIDQLDQCLNYLKKAQSKKPEVAELLLLEAKVAMRNAVQFTNNFSLLPVIENESLAEDALELFRKAENQAKQQRKTHLVPECIYGVASCLLFLNKKDDALDYLKELDQYKIFDELKPSFRKLRIIASIQGRKFDEAMRLFQVWDKEEKIPYEGKRLYAWNFLIKGAPEQALEIVEICRDEADKRGDPLYYLDLSRLYALLDRKDEAIGAV